ncbi:Gfo/Idh/MocA family oxidoreductase [Acuticoccus sp. M5D2P5]|uniref:Gfo/Idh/MocA family protein n=1 Tax=Acuticoccus kalidii TaxID=2910977 RepID=UPI001F229B14|nr:Gfo/Idh/MocA family oxidoreductase [Acuticoccus kalidii]MCF3935403.1 Gfo/Idh/MocA family oxidoreductase [Acuticoccus kalidii]
MIHVGVVGTGSFGRHHVRHLSQHPRVGRVTVVDSDRARAEAVAATCGAAVETDLAALDVDAAVITVPTEWHRSVADRLIATKTHLFIEKPIAASDADAAHLIAAADRAGVILQVGHIERFSVLFQALSERVSGVRHIVARRLNMPRPVPPTADVVLDLMIHDIDLAISLAGSQVREISARGESEAAEAHLRFANGVTAELSASRLSEATQRTLHVDDATGSWCADLAAGTLTRTTAGRAEPQDLPAAHDNLGLEIDEFVRAALGEATPRVDGRAGAAALAVANRIRAALANPKLQLTA